MRKQLFQFLALVLVILPNLASAKPNKNSGSLPTSKLSTDMRFDDMNVHGQRQSPFGATSSVESDKATPSLIDFRKTFDDRIVQSRSGR